jgi:hypothetical protein
MMATIARTVERITDPTNNEVSHGMFGSSLTLEEATWEALA